MSAGLDAPELAELLAERVDSLVPELLSGARRSGGYWTAGNVEGEPGGSLYAHRVGPKVGRWTDAATGQFGDLLDLINHAIFGGQDLLRAMQWASDRLRLDPDRPPPQTPSRAERPKPHQHEGDEVAIAVARNHWSVAQPIARTLGETYFRRWRAITGPLPPTLRFRSALQHTGTGLALPAVIAAISGQGGKITAIQRIFLDLHGRKASVADAKKTLGRMLDGAIRLAPAGELLGLAEGLETALSAQELHGVPVRACCGRRYDAVTIPDTVEHLIIFGDNGKPGHEAATKAEIAHAKRHRRIELRFPAGDIKDWNDVAQAIARGEAAA